MGVRPGAGGQLIERCGKQSATLYQVAMSKRPRSQPDLVEALCAAIEALTARRASRSYGVQWIMLDGIVSV